MAGGDGGAGPGARHGWRWDVALSFAGAQRPYVEQVAAALQARGVRCFCPRTGQDTRDSFRAYRPLSLQYGHPGHWRLTTGPEHYRARSRWMTTWAAGGTQQHPGPECQPRDAYRPPLNGGHGAGVEADCPQLVTPCRPSRTRCSSPVDIGRAQREGFADAQPSAPVEDRAQGRWRMPVRDVAGHAAISASASARDSTSAQRISATGVRRRGRWPPLPTGRTGSRRRWPSCCVADPLQDSPASSPWYYQ